LFTISKTAEKNKIFEHNKSKVNIYTNTTQRRWQKANICDNNNFVLQFKFAPPETRTKIGEEKKEELMHMVAKQSAFDTRTRTAHCVFHGNTNGFVKKNRTRRLVV
jgi:hypothetical protein